MRPAGRALAALAAEVVLLGGCSERLRGGGELRARKVVLEREVAGLREVAARLEQGEPAVPLADVAVTIDEGVVRDLINAQLPFAAEVDRFHVDLTGAEAQFRGSPTVRLHGRARLREHPEAEAELTVLGALEGIRIAPGQETLGARIAVDHLTIERAAGLESWLGGSTLDEVARRLRRTLQDELPPVQIPVAVKQEVDLPAVTSGPVRLEGARLPLEVSVSQVIAAQGRLWVGVHVVPGEMSKLAGAPAGGR